MMLGKEAAIRAIGMALAALSAFFAIYMLAYGGGKTRVNGMEHLAIFAQPRGAAAPPARGAVSPSAVDLTTTGSVAASPVGGTASIPRPVEIVAARADRVWLRIDGAIRAAAPGDEVAGVGRIGAIVERDGGWALLDDKGATLLAVARGSNGAPLFARKMIFQ